MNVEYQEPNKSLNIGNKYSNICLSFFGQGGANRTFDLGSKRHLSSIYQVKPHLGFNAERR